MTRTLHLTAALLLAAAALAGCSDDTEPAAAPTTSPTAAPSSAAPKNEVECVNVDRAYNAWDGPTRPKTADDFEALNLGGFNMAMESGKDFSKAVTGYEDQASKVLASAVASYNLEVAIANADMTISGKMEADQAKTLEQAASKVEGDYQAWRTATCS